MRAFPGCSSVSNTVSPLRDFTVTGAISFLKCPASMAALARFKEAMAKLSCSSRVKLYMSAHSSAKVPIKRPLFS